MTILKFFDVATAGYSEAIIDVRIIDYGKMIIDALHSTLNSYTVFNYLTHKN